MDKRAKIKYTEEMLCVLHRKSMVDVRIYEWVSCSTHLIPSLSIRDACLAFIKFHKVNESQLTMEKMSQTYLRMRKEIFEELKTINQNNEKI